MEGDAGAGRLNPADGSSAAEAAPDAPGSAPGSGTGVDQAGTAAPGSHVSAESPVAVAAGCGPSRIGRTWVIGICAGLILVAGAVAAGGYLGLRYHRQIQTIARDNAAALDAAKDCVLATQAPDTADIAAAEQKIIECASGEFRTQAMLYTGVFVQAYRAANVRVQLSEMRAAVERDNDDGSVDVLVALRVKVDNVEAQGREFGYRLRAQMTRDDGRYRIAKLDQVSK